jgi:hypothetical protein
VYERPYDSQQPVICINEKPITRHANLRPARPAAPGWEPGWTTNMSVARLPMFLRSGTESREIISLSLHRAVRPLSSLSLSSPWHWHRQRRIRSMALVSWAVLCRPRPRWCTARNGRRAGRQRHTVSEYSNLPYQLRSNETSRRSVPDATILSTGTERSSGILDFA